MVLGSGVGEDVLELKTELLVGCEPDVELGAAESVSLSVWSVAVGAEDSVGCGSAVVGTGLAAEVATGWPTCVM